MSDNSNNGINDIADTLKKLLQVNRQTLKMLEQIRDKPERSIPKNPVPDRQER